MKKQKGGDDIVEKIYLIGENHQHSLRTIPTILEILKKIKKEETVEIITELGMCRNFQDIDDRIVACHEEPFRFNMLSTIITLMVTLCLYHIPDNRQLYHTLLPGLIDRGYIPNIKEVKTEADRNIALSELYSHIIKVLRECAPGEQFNTYKDLLQQWLEKCTDTTNSLSLGNDLRDRWFASHAKERAKKADHIIIIVGLAHLSRVTYFMGPTFLRKKLFIL